MRRLALAVVVLLCLALLALSPVMPALAQAATATYTPIPTRTQTAATQAVIVVTVDESPLLIDKRATFGDVYIVTALAAIFALIAIAFAYMWVKSHIRVQEQ